MKRRMDVTSQFSLPEGCLAEILSRTTPRDVCRLSVTSSAFNSAAQSDCVWSAFLPSDVDDIIGPADDQLLSLSKRDFFFRLCGSIYLPSGMSFSLDRESGRKCYMYPSTMMFNANGITPNAWKWTSSPKSGNNSVLKFSRGSRISLIQGKIQASLLSPSTCYSAYLIFELLETASDYYPVSVGVNIVKTTKGGVKFVIENRANLTVEPPLIVPLPCYWHSPQLREDGWIEVLMANFYNDGVNEDDADDEVEVVLKSSKALVSTLYVQGIEIRPTE